MNYTNKNSRILKSFNVKYLYIYFPSSACTYVPMYLCTYIRLLCEKAIMNPPQTSREGQGGGKEGFRPSGYSGLNQENF